jgi:RNA polymerase sigma factor (sigma-70 family)
MNAGVEAQPPIKPAPLSQDEELVSRCLSGDERAWTTLVDKYSALVWSVPLKYRLTPEDGADIFQAVWMDLFAELKNLRHANALRSWLVTAASHKCYHWKRRQQPGTFLVPAEPGWDPEDTSSCFVSLKLQIEREQLLRDALSSLPERCRNMITMLFFEDPPRAYNEVAKDLGLAIGSIGFIRMRCLKKLKQSLEEMDF